MPVDQTSLDRIRNATFPSSKRGYDKHEVEKFLARLADWLETGAGDDSRSDTVKRELERVGQRTGAILAQAEESAQQIRAEAEEEARGTVNKANMEAVETRTETERYASETRASADAYSEQTRQAAEQEAQEVIESAQAQARRIVEDGAQRREDLEAGIADLVRRRNDVLADAEELSAKLTGVVSEHRPEPGADTFGVPEELDPLAREEPAEVPELDPESELDPEPEAEPEEEGEEAVEEEVVVEDEVPPADHGSTEETQIVDSEPQRGAWT
jgi:DivIVA domain-containing protein